MASVAVSVGVSASADGSASFSGIVLSVADESSGASGLASEPQAAVNSMTIERRANKDRIFISNSVKWNDGPRGMNVPKRRYYTVFG
jgi:hypothetical protein